LDLAFSGDTASNLTVSRHDLTRDDLPADEFDLVHARLVLEHLADPSAAVTRLVGTLRAGGWLVIEDADGLTFETDPATAELAAVAAAWETAAVQAGWDSRLGGRLLRMLRSAGLVEIGGRSHRSLAPGGEAWIAAQFGLRRLRAAILACGATASQMDAAAAAFADPSLLVTGPPIVSAWGRRR
jgi:SAM-dependent methyltransferase